MPGVFRFRDVTAVGNKLAEFVIGDIFSVAIEVDVIAAAYFRCFDCCSEIRTSCQHYDGQCKQNGDYPFYLFQFLSPFL